MRSLRSRSQHNTPGTKSNSLISDSSSSINMNLSSSEHFQVSMDDSKRASRSSHERVRPSDRPTTPQSLRKILAETWHGEKSSPRQPGRKASVPGPARSFPSQASSTTSSPGIFRKVLKAPSSPGEKSPSSKHKRPNLMTFLKEGSSSLARGSSSHRGSTTSSVVRDSNTPVLYKYARKCRWEDFEEELKSSKEDASYVYQKDGTTCLHLAVMSRTGYVNNFKTSTDRVFRGASLDIVEKLLKLDPSMGKVTCSLNGYTPLMYACLVCDDEYDVQSHSQMVRLFLKYCPESMEIFSKEGLSPVDIHIVSYSAHHKDKEEDSGIGQTSTHVLRTLLTHTPSLGCLRIKGDKVQGPLEYLYKCNAKAFSKAVMNEVYQSDDEEGTVRSDFTIPERRQQVVDTVKKWWIWTWTVMILKYGSFKYKKRGSPFAAVHSAVMQVGCPTPILSITLYAFPRQIKQPILEKEEQNNLPLHAVCSWPCPHDTKTASEAMVSTRKSMAISRTIEEYPLAIKVSNSKGETALELALKTGTTWDGGVRRLVKAHPKALKLQSKTSGLYPFMTAAAAATEPVGKRNSSSVAKIELQAVRTIYGLLRSNPKVCVQAWQKGHVDDDEEM